MMPPAESGTGGTSTLSTCSCDAEEILSNEIMQQGGGGAGSSFGKSVRMLVHEDLCMCNTAFRTVSKPCHAF